MVQRVFVYGTLLRGERNHHWLRGARYLGAAHTSPRYTLWSLQHYPVVCLSGRHAIRGEVYQISSAMLRRLDLLEEYPRYYLRLQQATPYGPAWIYYQKEPPIAGRLLPGGDWRRRSGRVITRAGFSGVTAVQGRHVDRA